MPGVNLFEKPFSVKASHSALQGPIDHDQYRQAWHSWYKGSESELPIAAIASLRVRSLSGVGGLCDMNLCEMKVFSVGIDPKSLIANSIIAAIVTDPRQQDNPIIACNEAFVRLTGYSREEIVGRNCRFLRGMATETGQTAMLREAIKLKHPIIVELTNYRKDGSCFRNAVMIAPLFDDSGELAYFLGSQMAIEDAEARRHDLACERMNKLIPTLND